MLFGRIKLVYPNFPISNNRIFANQKFKTYEKLDNTLPASIVPNQTPEFIPTSQQTPPTMLQTPSTILQTPPTMLQQTLPTTGYQGVGYTGYSETDTLSQNISHPDNIDHLYTCIKCRHIFLSNLNFHERNAYLSELIPYVFLAMLVFIIIKHYT